jgi:hypothetical protein
VIGVHARGRGPGDTSSLPYFAVPDVVEALERVEALSGTVVHPGEAWAICKDSEGSPFGLARQGVGGRPDAASPPALEQWSAVPSRSQYRPRNRHVLRRAAANRATQQ